MNQLQPHPYQKKYKVLTT